MIDHLLCPMNGPIDYWHQGADALLSSQLRLMRKALKCFDEQQKDGEFRPFKLGVVRTYTIESQVDALRLALRLVGAMAEVRVANINNIEQELLDPDSELLGWKPDAILVLWRAEDLLSGTLSEAEKRLESLVSGYLRHAHAPIFFSSMPLPYVLRLQDLSDVGGTRIAIDALNAEMVRLAAKDGRVHILDIADWQARFGEKAIDRKMSFYAAQPIAGCAIGSFAAFVARTLRPLIAPSSKVLALDLDNVLWGGILGEDGIAGLRIGHDFPGNIYFAIQQRALCLKRSGVLLVLLSKNNITDVKEAFDRLSMPLCLDDFAALRVNWHEKHANLKEVAGELNLGIDSFVFLDDQPFEQDQMRFNLPQVKVMAVSGDPLEILTALERTWVFDSYGVSQADILRNDDYQAQSHRKALEAAAVTPEQFLYTLDLQAGIAPVDEYSIGRVVQMLGKTNQFNLTTRRHSEAAVRAFCENKSNILLTLSLSDRFGDQGIVGLLIALAGADGLMIDSFLLSCRAIGKGAENVLWSRFLEIARPKGFARISAEYIPSEKNAQVANFYDRLGLKRRENPEGSILYDLSLPCEFPCPGWIASI